MTSELHHHHHPHHPPHHTPQNSQPHSPHPLHHHQQQQQGVVPPVSGLGSNAINQQPLSGQGGRESRVVEINHHHHPQQQHPHHEQQQPHHNRHGSSRNGTPSLKQRHQQQQQQQHHGGGQGLNNNNNNFVFVELHRDDATCPGFGFNIKGGAEHGCPVYIWRVEPGSLADRSGLKSGDEIVQANGISFGGITHAEALKVLKGQTSLTLYIKAPGPSGPPPTQPRRPQPPPPHNSGGSHPSDQPMIPLPPPLPPPHSQHGPSQQMVPHHSLHHRVEYYTWVDRLGNPVPPPTPQDPFPPSRLIPLEICPGQNLGLMIRGGSEYGLGIYVTGVDPGSVAERVGLQRGDEILSVNSKDFTKITHDKAVQILKSSKHMQIVATHIGKIPADLNDGEDLLKLGEIDTGNLLDDEVDVDVDDDEVANIIEMEQHQHTTVPHSTESHHDEIVGDDDEEEMPGVPVSTSSISRMNMDESLDLDFGRNSGGTGVGGTKRCTTSILQMIEEKARTVLNKSEHSRFTFYRIEYMQGFLPVVAFVRNLLELLNTSEKYTLLTEVRELIRPTDLTQFDELIYSKSFRVSSSSTAPSVIPPTTSIISTSAGQLPPNPPPPIFDRVVMPDPNNQPPPPQQQQQIPLPPPLPPQSQQPPQNFIPQQQPHPDHLMQDEMVVDDFIEEHGVVLDPNGGFGAWGRGVGQQQMQQQQQGQVNPPPPNFGAANDRQLLITHDPAALTLSHPQVLNVMNPSITSTPATTTTTVSRSPNNANMLVPQHPTSIPLQLSNKLGTVTTTSTGGQLVVANSAGGPTSGGGSSSVPAVRFKVRITKVKPILGIAIEGGSNTPHRLPRIIDVNPDGSAFHSNLRAGQVLLTVDGKKLDGLTHEEIARLILDCYVDMTKSQIEFLVVEAKQNYYYFNSQQSI